VNYEYRHKIYTVQQTSYTAGHFATDLALGGQAAAGNLTTFLRGEAESWIGTGVDATEAAYRERAPRSRFIHLAAHGRVDGLVPSRSRIELAQGRKADGRHTAEEIAALPLRASLVTLSGCGTARGDRAR
jgi:hypothetical protein